MRLVLSPKAIEDIENIYAYTLAHWDADQADGYRDRIFSTLGLLEDYPELGRALPGNPLSIHVLRIEQHNAFYRVVGDRIRILRLSHIKRHGLPELA